MHILGLYHGCAPLRLAVIWMKCHLNVSDNPFQCFPLYSRISLSFFFISMLLLWMLSPIFSVHAKLSQMNFNWRWPFDLYFWWLNTKLCNNGNLIGIECISEPIAFCIRCSRENVGNWCKNIPKKLCQFSILFAICIFRNSIRESKTDSRVIILAVTNFNANHFLVLCIDVKSNTVWAFSQNAHRKMYKHN